MGKLPNFAKQNILECLRHLSDPEWQERVWVRGAIPGVESSLSELTCQLYDDTGLGDALDESNGDIVLSLEADSLLRKLDHLLSKIDDSEDIQVTLFSAQWQKVVKLATETAKEVMKLSFMG